MKSRKRGVRKEDEFLSTMEKVMKFIVRHRETAIFVGISFVVGCGLLVYFLSQGEKENPQAEILQTQAIGMLSVGRLQDAEKVLVQLTETFQNTRPGKIGLYYLGVIKYHSGKFAEALDYFDKFLALQKRDYLLVPSALFGAACAAEGLKDYERALGYYRKLIKDKESKFYLMGLLAYGRVNGILGHTDEARRALNELLKKDPPRSISADARFYLGYFNK